MSLDPFDNDLSELQQEILRVYDRNPDAGPKDIANIVDCSESYARETINEYRDDSLGLGL